jgi:hypothetical protein
VDDSSISGDARAPGEMLDRVVGRQILAHASIVMTQRYARIADEMVMREAIGLCTSPL